MTKTATKSPQLKSLSEYIQERFDEFSRSQKDVARYIVDHLDEAAFLTAEELARRASTSSSTVVRFSQALGFEGYPELQQAAIEEYRNATVAGNGAAGGQLFSFDHSELEGSLSADYANLEETARQMKREQIDGAVAALAEAQRVVIVGVDQMAFFASYLRHMLSLLDIRAEAQVQGLDASVLVQGTGLRPEITFASVPPLPQDELLSRLLFGTDSSYFPRGWQRGVYESQRSIVQAATANCPFPRQVHRGKGQFSCLPW